jgi:DNA polymerase
MNLEELRQKASVCNLCDLHKGRINPVFDKGNPRSQLMIVGMVPAYDENKTGIPFVGRAGKLLDEILSRSSLSLDDAYVTNLVKCFLAPGKDLDKEWIERCLPYLIVQIHLVKPLVIMSMGVPASINLLGLDSNATMKQIRGKVFKYNNIDVIPTYHPSFLLRSGGVKSDRFDSVLKDFDLANYILRVKKESQDGNKILVL